MMVARMKRIAGEKAAVFLSGDLNTTYDNALLDPLKAIMEEVLREESENSQQAAD